MTDPFLIKGISQTEKSNVLRQGGKYVFMVKLSATKNEIKKALKERYRVDALDIAMIRRKAKTKRFRPTVKVRDAYKKAIVTFKQGQAIENL